MMAPWLGRWIERQRGAPAGIPDLARDPRFVLFHRNPIFASILLLRSAGVLLASADPP